MSKKFANWYYGSASVLLVLGVIIGIIGAVFGFMSSDTVCGVITVCILMGCVTPFMWLEEYYQDDMIKAKMIKEWTEKERKNHE